MARSHYEVLSVRPDATVDEIHTAYRALARTQHPDSQLDATKKAQAEERFGAITEAFNILTNEEKRREYDAALRSQSTGGSQSDSEAKQYFRAGTTKLAEGSAADAVRLFKAAVHLDATQATYHAHLGKALQKTRAFGEATRSWEQATRLDPYNAKYFRMAGQCYEEAGMATRARRMYERALKWDKDDAVSAEGLGRVAGPTTSGGFLGGLFRKAR